MESIQQLKDIENFSELGFIRQKEEGLTEIFSRLLGQFNLNRINALFDQCKCRGVDPKSIFHVLFMLPFVGLMNVRSLLLSGYSEELTAGKDAYYTFLSNPRIPWRKIVILFARQFLRLVKRKSVDGPVDSPQCLVVDDSILEKRGKKMEFIGRVFDHSSHGYILGYKLLTLGFWDGKSFLPVDFSIHHEGGKNKKRGLKSSELKKQYKKQRKKVDAGWQRVSEISRSKSEVALQMIRRAVKCGFCPKYVLADSWFISAPFIKAISGLKRKASQAVHVIGLMKTNRCLHLNNKIYKANKLPELKRKQIKKSRKLKCSYIPFLVQYKGTDLKVFFVRMNGHQNWKLLITTDTHLSFIKAMEYYQIRWSIEVFFKDCKQNLYLGKCQSVDFDTQIAAVSICFMNYMLLTLYKRFQSYESLGEIFKAFKDKIIEDTIVAKLWKLFIDIYTKVLAELGVDCDCFVHKLINQVLSIDQIKASFAFLYSPGHKQRHNFVNIMSET